MFPGNGKSKTLLVQTVYLIHFIVPSTNEEVRRKIRRAPEYSDGLWSIFETRQGLVSNANLTWWQMRSMTGDTPEVVGRCLDVLRDTY